MEQLVMEEVKEEVKPKRTRKTAAQKEAEVAAAEVVAAEKPKTTRTRKKKEETAEAETAVEAKEEKPKTTRTRKAPAKKAVKAQEFLGTGKRKSSVARVRLSVGTGSFKVNGQELNTYFDLETLRYIAKQPLMLTQLEGQVDVTVNVYGGGTAGQAGAIRHGITKALIEFRPELRPELKKAGFVTRDARVKERKKYGLKKARKAPQFSKR